MTEKALINCSKTSVGISGICEKINGSQITQINTDKILKKTSVEIRGICAVAEALAQAM